MHLSLFKKNLFNFIKGDSLVIDRYIWFKKNLPVTRNNENLLDIGCGSGAFTIESALMGYNACGISWDKENQKKAELRSFANGVSDKCDFPVADARKLNKLFSENTFDYVINFENIEHIIDDSKLMRDIFTILKPGGFLFLTTPYFFYNALSKSDLGPFEFIENGGHVRRGYTKTMLEELCQAAGFKIEKIDYCSGIVSQLTTKLIRFFEKNLKINVYLLWLITSPLRPLAFIFELLPNILKGKCYTICLIAYKSRK
jgi:2-polyprenyl-3-methyl-5-hydroxy-6-metoxy-1,4-benzoquinol methylase